MALRRLALATLSASWMGLVAWPAVPNAAVVFTSNRCQATGCREAIWTMGDDGSHLRPITDGGGPDGERGARLGNETDTAPAWSRAADRVVFAHNGGYGGRIMLDVVNVNGSGRHRISPPDPPGWSAPQDNWPDWSPLGGLIAFDSNRPIPGDQLSRSRIWVMTEQGLGAHPISFGVWDHLPRFTPDGLRVVFIRYGGFPNDSTTALMSVPVTGGLALPVVFGDLAIGPFGIAVSPDSRTFGIASGDAAGPGLFLLDSPSGAFNKIVDGGLGGLAWSQNGPALYYDSQIGDAWRSAIYSVAPRVGAKPHQVTDGTAWDNLPDWSSGDVLQPVKDLLPPAVAVVASRSRSRAARAARASAHSRIRFAAVDASGVRWVRAAIARHAGAGRCRFLSRGRFAQPTRCSRPRWFRVRSARAWQRTTSRLGRGRVRVWFRTRDGAGNVTRHPRPTDLRLR